jgi:hypothetical protein
MVPEFLTSSTVGTAFFSSSPSGFFSSGLASGFAPSFGFAPSLGFAASLGFSSFLASGFFAASAFFFCNK